MLNCNLFNNLRNEQFLIKIAMILLVSSFCNSAIAVTNNRDLHVDETFYVPKRFDNIGGLFVTTNGSMVGNIYDAKCLIIGKDPNGNTKPTNFITGGTIGGIPIIKVHAGSTFTSIHNIASVSKEFIVESDSSAAFNNYVIGSGDFINNGDVTIEAHGTIGPDFKFFNNGNLNVAGNFIVSANVKKLGKIHVIGATGTISGDLRHSQLHIGTDSLGTKNPNVFTVKGDVNNLLSLDISAGSSFNIPNDKNITINYVVSGSGAVHNKGALSLVAGAVIDPTMTVSNAGDLNLEIPFAMLNRFSNSGSIFLTKDANLFGDLTGGKSLNIGRDLNGNTSAINYSSSGYIDGMKEINVYAGQFIAAKSVKNCQQINNFAEIYIKDDLESSLIINNAGAKLYLQSENIVGTIQNHAGANLFVEENMLVHGKIDNFGTLLISAPLATLGLTNAGTIETKHTLNVGEFINSSHFKPSDLVAAKHLQNNGKLRANGITTENINNNGSIITSLLKASNVSNNGEFLVENASISKDLVNSGKLTAHFLIAENINNNGSIITNFLQASADVSNHGYLEINNTSSAVNVLNTKHLLLAADLLAYNFDNSGTLVTKGNRSLGPANFTSSGQQKFTITNKETFDSLHTRGVVDISNGTINVASRFIGDSQIAYSWDILAGAAIISNDQTQVVIPASTMLRTWGSRVVNNALQVVYSREPFTKFTTHGLETDIANALEKIAVNSSTDDHFNLIHAVTSVSSSKEYADNILKLKPNANGNANYISMHNATFKKVETRISAIKEDASALRGIAVGDLTSSMASWGAAFGSVANQQAIDGNLGYRATAFGAIFGVDQQVPNDDIYGAAVALSNSNINEAASTDSKTHITGYHFLVYGTNFFYGDNFFEWLFTGIINQNKSEREVILGGNNLNVASTYHNYQGGVRINLGKNMDFCSWGLAQVNTLQYSFLHQPSYNENGSPAALHIADFNSNIVTLGSGLRVFIRPDFHSALVAKPALHAMLTYDAVSSSKGINANFLIGDSDFTISQNPARIAVKMGADIGFEVKDNWQLQFSYDLEIRSRYTDNSAEIKLKYLF